MQAGGTRLKEFLKDDTSHMLRAVKISNGSAIGLIFHAVTISAGERYIANCQKMVF
jgi:hypothetical protein